MCLRVNFLKPLHLMLEQWEHSWGIGSQRYSRLQPPFPIARNVARKGAARRSTLDYEAEHAIDRRPETDW